MPAMKCTQGRLGTFRLQRCEEEASKWGPAQVVYDVHDTEGEKVADMIVKIKQPTLSRRPVMQVGWIEVAASAGGSKDARKGLGTKLYERALKDACKRGATLVSDDTRSPFAEAFWRKQEAKGRALCVGEQSYGSYYSVPLETLEWKRDRGLISQATYEGILERLPAPRPSKDGNQPTWECDKYEIIDACKTKSLARLGRLRSGRR